jgi:uncharacterized protein YcbX
VALNRYQCRFCTPGRTRGVGETHANNLLRAVPAFVAVAASVERTRPGGCEDDGVSEQAMRVGRVRALYRYPVKSTAGQALPTATVTAGGLRHDRAWAAYTGDGGIASGKRTRRFRPVIGLMTWASEAEDGDDVPVLVNPQGVRYRADDPAASEALTAAFGQRLTLRRETTIQHHDESPLHLLTTSSLAAVESLVGGAVDQRRFRANIIIDTGVEPKLLEEDWAGADLAIGSEVVLHMGPGMPRCVMVDQPQAGVLSDPKALRSLGEHHALQLGLQAHARRMGTIRVGDVASLRRSASP